MRFAPLVLAATALFGTVFSAPVPTSAVAKRDIDYVSVVTDLQADISAAIGGIADVTVIADVSACLTTVHSLLGGALTSLDISADVSAVVLVCDVAALAELSKRDDLPSEVAAIVGTILTDVTGLLGRVGEAVLGDATVQALLGEIDAALCRILNGLDGVLGGVLALVAGILGDLGISLGPLLGSVAGTIAEGS